MKLSYIDFDSSGKPYWHAETNNGDYDGAGTTPIDAVCAMVNQMERELKL